MLILKESSVQIVAACIGQLPPVLACGQEGMVWRVVVEDFGFGLGWPEERLD